MKRIAIISDIHGNITALSAVLNYIKQDSVDEIICLGDLVGKGPQPSEAIEICKRECSLVIKGNWDDMIASCKDSDEEFKWHLMQLSQDQIEYLKNLPDTSTFMLGNKVIRLFHSSSIGIYNRVHMHDSIEKHNQMFENTEFTKSELSAQIIGYGDIHGAYIKYYRNKILFNAGSVGNPLDINQSSFVIIEEKEWNNGEKTLNFEFKRVIYDINIELEIAKKKNMPKYEEYKKELLTAVYRNRSN